MPLGDGTYLVDPGPGVYLWMVLSVLGSIAGTVTAAKGRWGWFLLGLVTFSLFWYVGAFQGPTETSVWARIRRRRLTQ